MKTTPCLAALFAAALLTGCGPKEVSTSTTSTTATKSEIKVEEKPHAPESHGMPGMADLFKGDEKKDETKK